MKFFRAFFPILSILAILSCAIPPERRITRDEFDRLRIANFFDIENSPEEILEYLNRDGQVVFEAWSKGKERKPYYIKIMATPEGPEVNAYPRE